jgi:hypothetical protein
MSGGPLELRHILQLRKSALHIPEKVAIQLPLYLVILSFTEKAVSLKGKKSSPAFRPTETENEVFSNCGKCSEKRR